MVKLRAPVEGTFHLRVPLTSPTANDNASLSVPVADPAVTATYLLHPKPPLAPQETEVSDNHTVDSHLLSPTRTELDPAFLPRLTPAIVSRWEPVPP